MCQYLSLFKIEFRNIKINFVDEDGSPKSRSLSSAFPEREAVEGKYRREMEDETQLLGSISEETSFFRLNLFLILIRNSFPIRKILR